MTIHVIFPLVMVLLWGIPMVAQDLSSETPPAKRESILDRVVVIEPKLITSIPRVFRWCDRLDVKKQRVNVGDAELYVEKEGKGTPLVLINGGPGGTHHYFHPWFSRARGYARVFYYDQRGCGLSDFKPGKDGYSVEQAINDLDAIRKANKIEKWVVLGYSYGGFLAQYYACTYPEHTSGLILLGASPGMPINTGSSRQGQFISEAERNRLKEIRNELKQLQKNKGLTNREYTQLLIYNNFINGDWKRQNFYKPSRQRIAQGALYEWDQDENFNGKMNQSESKVDLTGAFELNPIPTLILEGKWDLTWGEKKPGILAKNHKKAKMIIFEKAGHGIYDEDPEQFFKVLEDFIRHLPEVRKEDLAAYKTYLAEWNTKRLANIKPEIEPFFKNLVWGKSESKKFVKEYSRAWLERFKVYTDFLRMGFALYDDGNYQEALFVYERMEEFSQSQGNMASKALSLIWQGHMLDLMGKRDEAKSRYGQAVKMDISNRWQHGQYGMEYELSSYAAERLKTPFERRENQIQ